MSTFTFRNRIWLGLGCCLFFSLAQGCHSDSSTSPETPPASVTATSKNGALPVSPKVKNTPTWSFHNDDSEFIGSLACAECHQEISASYQTHPMSHSMYQAADIPLEPDQFHQTFDPSGLCRYSVSLDGGQLQQSEEFIDADGNSVYRESVPMHYAVGSGRRGWSFVNEQNGILTQGVATWYSTRELWDLSPGYQPDRHLRFGRRISDGCVACHAGRTNHAEGESNRFKKPIFAEMSIGCERCHGPGKSHSDYHRMESKGNGGDPISNIAALGFSETLSLCYQCHLHGEERIVRSGRSEFDFRPGEKISDVWVTFVIGSGVGSGTTTAVSQVEQMHVSRCFTNSGQRMTCTTCHDPHSSPDASQRVSFYRDRCLTCHGTSDVACRVEEVVRRKEVADDSCIECHMPSLEASDVPHTSQTDHRVVRFRDQNRISAEPSQIVLMDPTLFPVPDSEQRRARGLLLAVKAETSGNATMASSASLLLTPLLNEETTDIALLDALATCHDLLGDHSSAAAVYQRAEKLAPKNERILKGLAVNAQLRGDTLSSLQFHQRVLQINPNDGIFQYQKVRLLAKLGQSADALKACQKAVELLPNRLDVRETLIQLADVQGEKEIAATQRKLVERIKRSLKTHAESHATPKSGEP